MGDYYDQGGQHGGGRRASGGYGGHHKRKRESEPIDPLRQLLHTLIYLGDDAIPVSRAICMDRASHSSQDAMHVRQIEPT
jgi:hypothetical protein